MKEPEFDPADFIFMTRSGLLALEFPEESWPAPLMNWNQRLHPHVRKERTKMWRSLAAAMARSASWKSDRPVRITMEVTFPTNHRRDSENLSRTAKAMVDGLVDADVIPDDCDGIVVGPHVYRVYPNGPKNLRLIVEVTPDGAFTKRRDLW